MVAFRGSCRAVHRNALIVGAVQVTVMSRIAANSIDQLRETGMLLTPLVSHRTIVQEMRLTQEWYGDYRKGSPVVEAYRELAEKIIR
jgi:chromosome partitioning protein